MAQITEEKLLEAIVNDDIKAFNALEETAQCGNFRLGRFPVLSLLYLYKSRKILSVYEQIFLKFAAWEELREPASVAKKFSEKAGKCLRLYLSEIVSPLEMLLILDDIKRLKRVYPAVNPPEAVKDRLKSIYSVKYSLDIKYEGNGIILDRRPLSSREKRNIALIAVSSFLAVAIAVATPVTTVSLMPKPVEGEVTKFSQIEFDSRKKYTLKNDITIPENFSGKNMSCTIDGNGKKLIVAKGASLGEFGGKLSDITIESSGTPIFTVFSEKASLSGVTININADIQTSESTALVAITNFGTIEGVTVNVSGKISALAGNSSGLEEHYFGGLVLSNYFKYSTIGVPTYGTIKNCTVNYKDFSLVGEALANAEFGGIAGLNGGIVENCTVTGEIVADTFDLAGVCAENSYKIEGVVNEADLIQSSGENWNPVIGGITINNAGGVLSCENKGKLAARSVCGDTENFPTVSVAGIANINSGEVAGCVNSGEIAAEGSGDALVGGIVGRSIELIDYCLSAGNITVTASTPYVGGIVASSETFISESIFGYTVYLCNAQYCISECEIKVTATGGNGGVGGIIGRILEEKPEWSTDEVIYYGGGAQNCYFVGSLICNADYFGSIAGVCGEYIFEKNLYTFNNTDYYNFKDNFYAEGLIKAYGATVSYGEDKEYKVVNEDKGATPASEGDIRDLEAFKDILEKIAR